MLRIDRWETRTGRQMPGFFVRNRSNKVLASRTRVIEFDLAGDIPETVSFLAKIWRAETSAPVPDLEALFVACDCNVRDALMRLEVKLSLLPPVCAPAPAVRKAQYVRRFDNRWIEVPA